MDGGGKEEGQRELELGVESRGQMTKGMQEQKKNEDGVYLFTSVHVRCNTESCFHHRGTKKGTTVLGQSGGDE